MILGHSIALDTNAAQEAHFRRACGVARFAWNWSLQKWQTMHAAGEKPSAAKIKAAWNAVRKVDFPWSMEVTKSASGQAILDLGTAFSNFFRDLKKPKGQRRARFPRFKSKRKDNGFALWNDQFAIVGDRIRIPHLGWVRMHEALRFDGKIMGARISRIGHRWHVSVQVETVGDKPSPTDGTVGIDLGISTLMTLSKPLPDGRTEIENPRARRSLLRRQRKLNRRISRQEIRRKRGEKASQRQRRRQDSLRRLHARVAAIRKDTIHKATTAVASNFSTVVLEDLNVLGMAKNHRLAGSILDASPYEVRRQIEYKVAMRGGRVVIADRFFPSSKRCHCCGHVLDLLPLHRREWTCPECGVVHHRDANAARNLELLVRPTWPEPLVDDPPATRGEIGALAAPQGVVKLWSVNRELQPDARAREVSASSQRK